MGSDDFYLGLINRAIERFVAEVGPDRAAELLESDDNPLVRAMPEIIEESAAILADELKRSAPKMIRERRANLERYSQVINEYWGTAFDLLDMVIVVAFETGVDFLESYVEEAEAEQDLVFYVLSRLQIRACRIAEEAAVLLKAGYGQGAHARWRALHEVVVVAYFIADHGADVARRYLMHEGIESWRAISEFAQRVERLPDYEPPTEQELREAKEEYDALLDEFGRPFGGQYGWAAQALSENPDVKGKRGFAAIEEDVGLDHLRSHYRLASHQVHANPKGIQRTPDGHSQSDALLGGPSVFGLANAGHSVCVSLTAITAAILSSKKGASTGFVAATMLRLSDEAGDAFLAAEDATDAEGPGLGDPAPDEDGSLGGARNLRTRLRRGIRRRRTL
jgi:hypothetical protein